MAKGVLALEQQASLVIIDERLGRKHARRLELSLTGTLGVLLRAKQMGLLPSVGPLLEELQQSGIWLSHNIVQETLRLAGE